MRREVDRDMHDLVGEAGEVRPPLLEPQRLGLSGEGLRRLQDHEVIDPVRHLFQLQLQQRELVEEREDIDDLATRRGAERRPHLFDDLLAHRLGERDAGAIPGPDPHRDAAEQLDRRRP